MNEKTTGNSIYPKYIGTIGEISEIYDEGTTHENYKVTTFDDDYWWFGLDEVEAHP